MENLKQTIEKLTEFDKLVLKCIIELECVESRCISLILERDIETVEKSIEKLIKYGLVK